MAKRRTINMARRALLLKEQARYQERDQEIRACFPRKRSMLWADSLAIRRWHLRGYLATQALYKQNCPPGKPRLPVDPEAEAFLAGYRAALNEFLWQTSKEATDGT